MPIRLLVADDQEVVRQGVKTLVKGTDIRVVAEAASGTEALKRVAEKKPDVVLMDIRMAEEDGGLAALGRIKMDHPELPVLILSTYDNPTYVAKAYALNAAGYVLKGAGRQELIDAVQAAAAGETLWTREILRRVTGALSTPRLEGDVEAPLTKRENEVLKLVTRGLTNKQIADRMKISYETVKEHVQHILRKIGVTDRTQAAVWAVRKGLV